jgi:(p)ppGpp synthase/HD superfamily hydrolase
MNLTPRINNAIKLACHLHRSQIRKDANKTPYISHLFAVATLISSVTDDEDIIIAGLMHDSLEDVPLYTYDMLVSDCGTRVAQIVTHVTEPLDANKEENEQLPWLTRKEKYLENLRSGGVESAVVSTADKIHNTESFMEDALRDGDIFTSQFHSSSRNKVWFHDQVLSIVTEKLGENHPLVVRLSLCTEQFRKLATLESNE